MARKNHPKGWSSDIWRASLVPASLGQSPVSTIGVWLQQSLPPQIPDRLLRQLYDSLLEKSILI